MSGLALICGPFAERLTESSSFKFIIIILPIEKPRDSYYNWCCGLNLGQSHHDWYNHDTFAAANGQIQNRKAFPLIGSADDSLRFRTPATNSDMTSLYCSFVGSSRSVHVDSPPNFCFFVFYFPVLVCRTAALALVTR